MVHSRPLIIILLVVFLVSALRLDLLAREISQDKVRYSLLAEGNLRIRVTSASPVSLRAESEAISYTMGARNNLRNSDVPYPDSSDLILLAQEDDDGDGIPDDPPITGRKWTEGEKRVVIMLFVSAFFLLAIFIFMDNLIEQDGIHVY